MQFQHTILATLIVACNHIPSQAQDNAPPPHTFRDRKGAIIAHGVYLQLKSNSIYTRQGSDEKAIVLPLKTLSSQDKAWCRDAQ